MQIRKGIILVSIRPIVLYLSVKVKRCTGNEEEVKFNCVVCSFARVKTTSNRVVGDQTGKKTFSHIQFCLVVTDCRVVQMLARTLKKSPPCCVCVSVRVHT